MWKKDFTVILSIEFGGVNSMHRVSGGVLRREGKGEKRAASGTGSQRKCNDVCLGLHYVHKHIGSLCDLS